MECGRESFSSAEEASCFLLNFVAGEPGGQGQGQTEVGVNSLSVA